MLGVALIMHPCFDTEDQETLLRAVVVVLVVFNRLRFWCVCVGVWVCVGVCVWVCSAGHLDLFSALAHPSASQNRCGQNQIWMTEKASE